MIIVQVLKNIFLAPLELVFEAIFQISFYITRSEGWSIILLSLVVSTLVLPLYKRAEKLESEQREKEKELSHWVEHIKKHFHGDEKYMVLSAYYRENHYSPLSQLKSSISLLLQIPFFLAAYDLLGVRAAERFAGTGGGLFGFDLGAPDGLLSFAGITINALPILMTLVNILACYIYTKGYPFKSALRSYLLAIFFLVFLYKSPSALLVYWTMNNFYSLFKTIIMKNAQNKAKKGLDPDASGWDTFTSISLGWRFDREKFFPIDRNIVNMFKLRASYGELGNEASVGDYAIYATMARNNMTYSFGNQPITGSAVSTFVNENLAWEKRKTMNVGLDLAFFNNRIEFTAEWYKNKSEDLLYAVPVPASAGVANTSVTMNAASLENSGFEFSITYRNRDHALKHEISANLSTLKNKVTSLGFGTERYITGAYITEVGQEVGKFYGWDYQGIIRTQEQLDKLNDIAKEKGLTEYQPGAQVGDCYYRDVNGDGQINADDQTVLGSGLPKVNFGLSAHFEYKIFDLSISTFGALGYHVTDYLYNTLNSSYGYGNKDVNILSANRWDGQTYVSDIPRTYLSNSATLAWNDLFCDRQIQNAAYWKIANVELGCNLPNKWFANYVTGVRIYVSAQNLFTITGYKGYNVDYAGGTFTPGYNYCSYPTARSFMAGINFTF